MAEPSLFVLGSQKCGSTTIADLLAAQPEIFVPSIKETYFFCDEALWAKGFDWYRSEFYRNSATEGCRVYCDATPFYLASKEAINRLADYADEETRFVVTLRDPVSRAYSSYWHQQRMGNESLSFEAALEIEPDRIAAARAEKGRWWRHAYTEVGRYAAQLDYAFEKLGRDRVLVLLPEDLKDVPKLQNQLREHVGLRPANSESGAEQMRSNSSSMPRSKTLHRLITKDNPLKSVVKTLLPREMRTKLGRKILSRNLKAGQYPPMDPATRARLEQLFAPEIDALMAMGITGAAAWKKAG